jgi:hypothetical protein
MEHSILIKIDYSFVLSMNPNKKTLTDDGHRAFDDIVHFSGFLPTGVSMEFHNSTAAI